MATALALVKPPIAAAAAFVATSTGVTLPALATKAVLPSGVTATAFAPAPVGIAGPAALVAVSIGVTALPLATYAGGSAAAAIAARGLRNKPAHSFRAGSRRRGARGARRFRLEVHNPGTGA